MWHAYQLWKQYSDALARKTFKFSIVHLMLMFARCWWTTTNDLIMMTQPPGQPSRRIATGCWPHWRRFHCRLANPPLRPMPRPAPQVR